MKLEAIHPECQGFVAVVEELLKRRQQEADVYRLAWRQDAWGPRTWTRTELEDMVYSSYKRMRQGYITRPPRRQVVMEIADYLNCTLEERNRLLIAAHTAPVAPYFTGVRLEELLQVTVGVARQLTLPCMVINRDWHIHYLNERILSMNGITPDQVAAIPPDRFNFLRIFVDPALPVYASLSENRTSWTRMVRQTIYGFKRANLLCQFESWYRELVEQLLTLPEFAFHWQTVDVDVPFDDDASARNLPPSVTVEATVTDADTRRSVWLRPLVISTGYFQYDFPQIVAFLPADENEPQTLIEGSLLRTSAPT